MLNEYRNRSMSGAAEASRSISTPCVLGSVVAYNGTGADAYLMVFDATSVPANGAVPSYPPLLVPTASPTQSWDFQGMRMSAGVSAAFSSTATTLTQVAGATNLYLFNYR